MYINAEEYLQKIRALHFSIRNKKAQLAELDKTIGISAIDYEAERINSSPRRDKLEMEAIKHLEKREKIQRRLENDITEMLEKQEEAVNYINMINSEEQQEVLIMRYIECMRWSEILDARGCDSINSQYRLHRRALESLQKILKEGV